eukprot:COSAG02_NODE_532_length_20668_cov_28.281832_5_plen_111_part_00
MRTAGVHVRPGLLYHSPVYTAALLKYVRYVVRQYSTLLINTAVPIPTKNFVFVTSHRSTPRVRREIHLRFVWLWNLIKSLAAAGERCCTCTVAETGELGPSSLRVLKVFA